MDQLHISPSGTLVKISPEDLAFILEKIKVGRLELTVNCPGFEYQKPIKHPWFFIESPSWVDFNKFSLAPNAENVNFFNQKVSDDVLNGLIKDWAEGKLLKLKEVQFTWHDNDSESVVLARGQGYPRTKTILPNRNIEQLKGRTINHYIKTQLGRNSVFYRVNLSVWNDNGLNGIHLEDQA